MIRILPTKDKRTLSRRKTPGVCINFLALPGSVHRGGVVQGILPCPVRADRALRELTAKGWNPESVYAAR